MIQECLGQKYVMIGSVCLQATHLVVFSTTRLSPLISNIETDVIATGFKNMIGNKGAVQIKFDLVDTSMSFINVHLHSGLNGVAKRNHDIQQIWSRFIYNRTEGSSKGSSNKVHIMPAEALETPSLPDVIIFMGDLNYRINGFKPSIMQAMGKDRYDLLIHSDQLLMERQLGNVPTELKEGHIAFAPTFKRKPFDNSSFGLKRNPAWTDRILFYCECNEEQCRLQLKSYDSNNMLDLSDHRPVFA